MRSAAWLLVLVGCGGAVQYGSFVDGRSLAQGVMAADAARKLAIEYAPDSHPLRLPLAATDDFGRNFEAELRRTGYAVQKGPAASSRDELQVRYVVDELKGTDLLRVTLYVQQRTLSRPYAERPRGVYPVAPWTAGGSDGS